MGKKSRQKRLRRELRPMIRASVAKARMEKPDWKIVPPEDTRASYPIHPDVALVLPTPHETVQIEASRQ